MFENPSEHIRRNKFNVITRCLVIQCCRPSTLSGFTSSIIFKKNKHRYVNVGMSFLSIARSDNMVPKYYTLLDQDLRVHSKTVVTGFVSRQ